MSREHKPYAPKIHRFELSEKNTKLRWILVCALVVIAVVAILIGVFGSRQKPGWYTVESASGGLHCGREFLLTYEYGAGGRKAAEEGKELPKLYTTLTENAWQLFYSEAGESALGNLYRVNTHPNEEVTVDPALYEAFRLLESLGSRLHYLGPVYNAYDQVFANSEAVLAAEVDPGQNADLRQYVLELSGYAADPNAIRLELRPDNKVFLHVSAEYKAFFEENMETVYVDFGWLRNAFIVDYMAQKLEENGFTNCHITSIDGFSRNLDRRDGKYQLNLFNRRGDKTELAASMAYSGAASVVYLRTYDSSRAYAFQGGRVVTYFVDIADGQCKTALENLVSYSDKAGCAEIAIKLAPSFIAYNFSSAEVNNLAGEEIYSIWFEDHILWYNQAELKLTPRSDAYILTHTK